MIHFNPIDYPTLNKREITLTKTYTPNKFEVLNKDGGRVYYGKRLNIFLNNTKYAGRYTYSIINETIKKYLIFEDDNVPTLNGNYTIYETFIIPEENQALTFQDIQEKFESNKTPAIVENISGINDIGSLNLVDGFETLKLEQSLFGFKTDIEYNLSNNSTQFRTFRIEPNKFNKYQIFLYSKNVNDDLVYNKIFINLELGVNGDCTRYYIKNHSHIGQNESFQQIKNQYINQNFVISNDIKISLTKIAYDEYNYVTINFQIVNDIDTNINIPLEGYIWCRHPQDLWTPEEANSGSKTLMKLNGQDQISIDQTLLYADNWGEQRTIIWGESIIKEIEIINKDIDTVQTNITDLKPGYYKFARETAPWGIPGKITNITDYTSDSSEYENDEYPNEYCEKINLVGYYANLKWTQASLVVLQNDKYMLYTNDKHIFIGKKDGKDIEWYLLSEYGHTHNTDDLIVGKNKFVTQEQIDTWTETTNRLNSYTWKPYLTDDKGVELTKDIEASLSGKGYAGIMFDNLGNSNISGNPIIYVHNGNRLIPVSIGALTVESEKVIQPEILGTLIKQSTLDKILGLGIGYRTSNNENNEQYILINNLTAYYKPDYDSTKSNKKFFDLVRRTHTSSPGDYSINLGFENAVAGDNILFLGTGLKSNNLIDSNKIVIGKWNQPIETALIEFGIGTGEDTDTEKNRKTAFWYSIENDKKIFTVDGNFFNNDNSKYNYILVNGADPIINDFVHYSEFIPVKEKIDEIVDNSIFIKLEPLDESIKPLIRRVTVIDDWSEYNIYDITFKLNGLNDFSTKFIENRNDDGELIYIEWKLKDNFIFFIKEYENPKDSEYEDDEDDEYSEYDEYEKIEINYKNFNDDGTLIVSEIKKASIIKIQNTSNNKFVEINLFDYINSLDTLSKYITINVTSL